MCPAEFTIGEHVMMLISTVTEGSDKPYKYPLAFEKADIILLNKVDLIPYLDFDEEYYMKGVRALNKDVPVFKVSGKTGEGYEEVAKWLQKQSERIKLWGIVQGVGFRPYVAKTAAQLGMKGHALTSEAW